MRWMSKCRKCGNRVFIPNYTIKGHEKIIEFKHEFKCVMCGEILYESRSRRKTLFNAKGKGK